MPVPITGGAELMVKQAPPCHGVRPFLHRLWFPGPRGLDAAAALSALVLTLLAVSGEYSTGLVSGYAMSMAVAAGYAVTLLVRRRVPELAGVASVLATLATEDTTPLIFSTWALARHGRHAPFASVGVIALGYYLTRPLVGESLYSGSVLYHVGVHVVLVAVVARVLCGQEYRNMFFREQVRRLQGTVDQAARYAVLEERTRLAFDMHDGIGHQVAVVNLQAAAVKVNAHKPDKVLEGVQVIEDASRAVMAELREILDMLRNDPGDSSPPVRLAEVGYQAFLESLVRNMKAIGVDAVCSIEGAPVPLPREIQSALYRTGQEGLSNAVKHAPGAPIQISLRFQEHWVALTIENGPSTSRSAALGGSGTGLEGLCARVCRLNGRFLAEPTTAGGFVLRARLPLPAEETRPSSASPDRTGGDQG
ncbi:sensor histidine kinase [Streptomyces sp. x-80]|uniref:sensor histidine kinase n=1 Tax=Streptomyces sp. x-80 TaxID=2789282 RepID=UPI00397F3E97